MSWVQDEKIGITLATSLPINCGPKRRNTSKSPRDLGAEAGEKQTLLTRTSYIIFEALCKMKMWGPLFKN